VLVIVNGGLLLEDIRLTDKNDHSVPRIRDGERWNLNIKHAASRKRFSTAQL